MEKKIIKFSPPHTISPYTVNPVIFEQAPANIIFPVTLEKVVLLQVTNQ